MNESKFLEEFRDWMLRTEGRGELQDFACGRPADEFHFLFDLVHRLQFDNPRLAQEFRNLVAHGVPPTSLVKEATGHGEARSLVSGVGAEIRRVRLSRPVGFRIRSIAEFLFSKKTFKGVFEPILEDLRFEYHEALATERRWRARWLRAIYGWSFVQAVVAQAQVSLVQLVVRIWKII